MSCHEAPIFYTTYYWDKFYSKCTLYFVDNFSLDGLDPNAYEAFQASRNLRDVVDRVMELRKENGDRPGMSKSLSVRASLMTPVLPMLVNIVQCTFTGLLS